MYNMYTPLFFKDFYNLGLDNAKGAFLFAFTTNQRRN